MRSFGLSNIALSISIASTPSHPPPWFSGFGWHASATSTAPSTTLSLRRLGKWPCSSSHDTFNSIHPARIESCSGLNTCWVFRFQESPQADSHSPGLPAARSPSRSSAPSTLSRSVRPTCTKRTPMPAHTRRSPSTGLVRSTGSVLARSLVIRCGSF